MTAPRHIPVSRPLLNGNELKYVSECIETNWISSIGSFVTRFENAFASWCGAPHAVATSSGTTALHLLLDALGIGPDDEIIVPDLTFVATANAVRYCGATPVFADCDPRVMVIDPNRLREKITPRTRAIFAVHLYGHPADMDPLREIAASRGLLLLEDAAEAHGAEYKGKRVGALGHSAVFSFFGNKILTTGEGGMVLTGDERLAARMRILRAHGMDPNRRYWFPEIGYNYRMTNLQAAVGLAQLECAAEKLAARDRVGALYDQLLAPLSRWLLLPQTRSWARRVHWLYTVHVAPDAPIGRDELAARLAARGIETRPVVIPMHRLPAYNEKNGYPGSDLAADSGLSLPTAENLSGEEAAYVASALREIIEEAGCR
ncbi:MAG: DegT/DnrJ/EryC1/StrS family aminotransferase [Bryobacteraceae bacterium]|nr:DegT/DnrJ/EryC1/StrS family aminotransferase [Bryobacteraceae bacterium]